MSRVFLCAILLLAVAPTTSGQNCALFGKKAKKCVKAGCAFTRVNNAKYKTCTNPPATAVLDAAATSIAAPAAVSVCPEFTSARKCRQNAACAWAKQAGKKHKTCVMINPAGSAAASVCPEITGYRTCRKNPACAWAKQAGKKWKKCVAYTPPVDKPDHEKMYRMSGEAEPIAESKLCTVTTPTPAPCLTDETFKIAIADCLAEDPVNGVCCNSTYGPMPTWCVADVTDFSEAFQHPEISEYGYMAGIKDIDDTYDVYAEEFNGDITSWDVSSGTAMEAMFATAAAFNQPIGEWKIGAAVTSFERMFLYAFLFNQPLAEWKTGASTSFEYMFQSAKVFNQPIGNWNIGASTSFQSMFFKAAAFNQAIAEWDTGASTNFGGMFSKAEAFNQPIGEWNIGAGTSFSYMFYSATAFNQPIGEWNTGAGTLFGDMFSTATAFNQPIAEWDTSNGSTNGMFNGATLMLADYTCPADGPPSSCSD